jgi:hypothetical protein
MSVPRLTTMVRSYYSPMHSNLPLLRSASWCVDFELWSEVVQKREVVGLMTHTKSVTQEREFNARGRDISEKSSVMCFGNSEKEGSYVPLYIFALLLHSVK